MAKHKGNSAKNCNPQFAMIERMKRNKDTAEMYTDSMIDSKYVTVEITGHMIHDYEVHFDTPLKKQSPRTK